MVLAWNPIREIPVGLELLHAAEEGPRNYHTDKCKGLHLRGEGALTGCLILAEAKPRVPEE
jgi:hypothetical protein